MESILFNRGKLWKEKECILIHYCLQKAYKLEGLTEEAIGLSTLVYNTGRLLKIESRIEYSCVPYPKWPNRHSEIFELHIANGVKGWLKLLESTDAKVIFKKAAEYHEPNVRTD